VAVIKSFDLLRAAYHSVLRKSKKKSRERRNVAYLTWCNILRCLSLQYVLTSFFQWLSSHTIAFWKQLKFYDLAIN